MRDFAAQEQKALIGVTEARAKVGTIQATPELINDAAAFQEVSSSSGRTLAGAQKPDRRDRKLPATQIGR